jgi:predicted HicB family RNase H-like nuclease
MPIRLPNDLYVALKKKAGKHRKSMNSLVTQAVADFLQEDSPSAN